MVIVDEITYRMHLWLILQCAERFSLPHGVRVVSVSQVTIVVIPSHHVLDWQSYRVVRDMSLYMK